MGFTSEEYYSFEAEGGELNYYFFLGPEVRRILESFTELTGRMPIPPKWSLGHHQCRYSYYPASRVLEIADRFRKEGIPADAIWLDIHYMDGFEVFTWDKRRFPDPKKLISKLREKGFKVVVIIDPGIKASYNSKIYQEGILNDYFCKYRTGEIYYGKLWPGICAFPDFTDENVRRWWGDLHRDLIKIGVEGIWNDMNEPTIQSRDLRTMDPDVIHFDRGLRTPHAKNHNVYGLLECQATYEGLLRMNPNKRPFILSRAGYAGIQRYAAVWTGDNTANWEHLALQIPMLLNLGLSGVPFVGCDIGGFIGTPSPELLVRWYQIGVFVPFCRNHTNKRSYDQEPWMFGDYYKDIIRRYLKLRYRLIPYLYTCFYEHWKKGYPIMRPLLFEFQDDRNTYNIQDEFLVGDSLLIAPIIKEAINHRLVYLPKGIWIDYWTHSPYEGPCYIEVEAPLDKVPIFVKAGSIIPMQPDMDHIDQKPVDPLILDVYPSKELSKYTLYEDDGLTLNYRKGQYCLTNFSCIEKNGEIEFTVKAREGNYSPPRRSFWIQFNNVNFKPKEVLLNQIKLDKASSFNKLRKTVKRWFYDSSQRTVYVKIPDNGLKQHIKLS